MEIMFDRRSSLLSKLWMLMQEVGDDVVPTEELSGVVPEGNAKILAFSKILDLRFGRDLDIRAPGSYDLLQE